MILSYCTNIHPAETWPETLLALNRHVLAVRNELVRSGDRTLSDPFPIGLRLSAQAAYELRQPEQLLIFKEWLLENRCFVFTINGFPYGSFHGGPVKEKGISAYMGGRQVDWITRNTCLK